AMAQSRTIESRFAMAGSVTLAAYSAEPPGLRSCGDFAGYGPGMVDQSTRFPDLSARPHELCVERVMNAPASLVYAALTRGFDIWLAAPDSVRMRAEVGEPFYFETEYEGKRNPHYGRFLRLVPDREIEFTWVTAATDGTETVVHVELRKQPRGIRVRLRHSGFAGEAVRDLHQQVWPKMLEQLEERISAAVG